MQARRYFLLAITGITLLTIGAFRMASTSSGISMSRLKLGMPIMKAIKEFDPIRIVIDWEAVVLYNLFTPLIMLDSAGAYEPGIAERWEWSGNALRFYIRKDARTVDGHHITAKDAHFTLLRAVRGGTNYHGDLASFLCDPDEDPKVSCRGIRLIDDFTLELQPRHSNYGPHLLDTLGNMDFGIIPIHSTEIEPNGNTRISDYRNTSGPYFVEKDSPTGDFVLRANPHHFLSRTGIPQEIQITTGSYDESLQRLTDGQIDALSTISLTPVPGLVELIQSERFNTFQTHPIQKLWIHTAPKARSKFSEAQRMSIISHIREKAQNKLPSPLWRPSIELIPQTGNGHLNPNQEVAIKTIYKTGMKTPIDELPNFSIGSLENRRTFVASISKELPTSQHVVQQRLNHALPEENQTDFFISRVDSAFYENINLLAYNLAMGAFPLTREEGATWFAKYLMTPDQVERLKQLNELHFRALKEGTIAVIAEAPYVALSRKPWRYAGSPYYAGAPLWMFRQD